MVTIKNLVPTKRRITIVLSFFVLLAALFSLFQFYYIPSNKNKLHQYGFTLLNRIKTNIVERDNDLRRYYSNSVEKYLEQNIYALRDTLARIEFSDRFISSPKLDSCNRSKAIQGNATDSCDGFGFAEDSDGWLRVYTFRSNKS